MNEENNSLQSLIQGGLIGAALGAVLAKDKEDGMVVGALIGAAIMATWNAGQTAINSNLPVYVEEDGKLFSITSDGNRQLIKQIRKSRRKMPDRFKLK